MPVSGSVLRSLYSAFGSLLNSLLKNWRDFGLWSSESWSGGSGKSCIAAVLL